MYVCTRKKDVFLTHMYCMQVILETTFRFASTLQLMCRRILSLMITQHASCSNSYSSTPIDVLKNHWSDETEDEQYDEVEKDLECRRQGATSEHTCTYANPLLAVCTPNLCIIARALRDLSSSVGIQCWKVSIPYTVCHTVYKYWQIGCLNMHSVQYTCM